MNIRDIRSLSGLSRSSFSEKYGIPLNTVRDWEQEKRKCPSYVVDLLEFKVKFDKMGETFMMNAKEEKEDPLETTIKITDIGFL